MSTNIRICAEWTETDRAKAGKYSDDFEAIQTPTKVTWEIMNSPNQIQAYVDWLLSKGQVIKMPMVAEDGTWLGYRNVNSWQEHVDQLNAWIVEHTLLGHNIVVDAF